MITWILEPDVFKDELTDLIDALNRHSINYRLHKLGFPYESYAKLGAGSEYVFHGSYQLAKHLKSVVDWKGLFCNFQKYECLYYYPRFAGALLNRNYFMLPFGVIAHRRTPTMFLKPSRFKVFTGTTIDQSNKEQKLRSLSLRADPEELIVLSDVKQIEKEWRAVVYKNEIIAISQYNENGQAVRIEGAPQEIIAFGNMTLESIKYNPDPIWILDLCQTDKGPSVLEVGPFACCGLYACNKDPIIEAVNNVIGDN